MCIEVAAGGTASACFDCLPGYWLTRADDNSGTCTRCDVGTGIAGGNKDGALAKAGDAKATRIAASQAKTTCTACHASCSACFAPASATSCTNCKDGMWANAFTTKVGGTCTACTNGKGRTAVTATTSNDLTDKEVEATVCSVTCATGAANCKGTNAADALYCAANYWLSTSTCTACETGKAKAASTAAPAQAETKDSCAICAKDTYYTATGCTACPTGKTRAAPTTAPTAVEKEDVCTTAAAAGSSATLIQALCGASVAAYALF